MTAPVMAADTGAQLGLFGHAPETRRLIDGLTCLRDVVPEALEVVVHLADWQSYHGSSASRSEQWWYSIRRDGLHFEGLHERPHKGWPQTLARRITWREIAEHVGDDPRRPGLVAWAESLTAPDRWKDLIRPHELWPAPGEWHPSYITGDHERLGWRERIAAWRDLLDIYTDAIAPLEAS